MQRLAWFSPVPPERSAVARHSADLLPILGRDRVVDLFTAAAAAPRLAGVAGQFDARDFVRRQRAEPYDLVVYHLGAAPCHDDVWPCLFRYPGLVVLHDDNLHDARARMLLAQGRTNDYRAEFVYNHPRAPISVAELGASGRLGTLNRLWPMRQTVLDSGRALLVHNAWLAEQIQEEAPALAVDVVELGVPDLLPHNRDGRATVRRRHGVPEEAVVFAATGCLTPARRISRIVRALAALPDGAPAWHLMLCGEPVDANALLAVARALGAAPRVTVTGRIAADDMPAYHAAADVGVSLSWPPTRTIRASWLRWLAAGKPTIVTDLVHASNVPALDSARLDGGRPSCRGRCCRTPDRSRGRGHRHPGRRPLPGACSGPAGRRTRAARRAWPRRTPPLDSPLHARPDGGRLRTGHRERLSRNVRRGAPRTLSGASRRGLRETVTPTGTTA